MQSETFRARGTNGLALLHHEDVCLIERVSALNAERSISGALCTLLNRAAFC